MKPGTVSKILWHFTGGPLWNKKEQRQSNENKSPSQAFKNIKSILQSKELRVGDYFETARFTIENRYIGHDNKGKPVFKTQNIPINSSRVCCIADVPVMHLDYLSERYGKFAIGFHRESIIKNGFNPVLYTLENSFLSEVVFRCIDSLESIDQEIYFDQISDNFKDTLSKLDDIEYSVKKGAITDEVKSELSDIHEELEFIKGDINGSIDHYSGLIENATNKVRTILAFIKTFNKDEFDSIYTEREWRSIKSFNFKESDIAMIVVPKKHNYLKKLCEFAEENLELPREIPIVGWEDLIEH
jgi:hypothetical protein